MRKELTIHLVNPITLKGVPVSQLTMREPSMAEEEDSMAMAIDMGRGQNPLTNEMFMYSLLCSIPYDAIRVMKSVDYHKLRSAYGEFVRPQPVRATDVGTPPASLDISVGE